MGRPLPASDCRLPSPRPAAELLLQVDMEERRRKYRALVIENDASILLLVQRILEREGFVVEGVKNGAEAIQLLSDVTYELLIIDLMLPVINGEQVLDFLDETKPETIRRVIVTTASPRLLNCEFLDRICRVLAKPFDIDQLILLARECMEPDAACALENE